MDRKTKVTFCNVQYSYKHLRERERNQNQNLHPEKIISQILNKRLKISHNKNIKMIKVCDFCGKESCSCHNNMFICHNDKIIFKVLYLYNRQCYIYAILENKNGVYYSCVITKEKFYRTEIFYMDKLKIFD